MITFYPMSVHPSQELIFYLDRLAGGHAHEAIPVPIPNTEVKLMKADGTYRETDWESR